MSEKVPLFSELDLEAEGRRALAKVYGILLKLGDEFEEDMETPKPIIWISSGFRTT